MSVDSRHQAQMGGIPYAADPLRYGTQVTQPQFNNPWVSGAAGSPPVYASSHAGPSSLETSAQMHQRPGDNLTLPPYNTLPITTTALASGPSLLSAAGYGHPATLEPPQNIVNGRQYQQFSAAPTTSYPAQAPGFQLDLHDARNGFGYASDAVRRPSHPFSNASQADRESFGEVIDASRQIISLSQSDITPTPRNMYGDQSTRSSPESYGFPPTHSAHSSISSSSGMHSNYGSSVGDYALSDYSSASESVDSNHRTLPRPQAVNNSLPPAPQSMMGQFSSKVSSSSQKKHKCKVCDKRFTRPSSLQTHIYSHTGEKPFACEVEGCGRHFSVVSNLRRHKKVHKNGRDSQSASVTAEE